MSRFRANPRVSAADVTRRLRRRGTDALPSPEEQRRRLIGAQSLAAFAAMAAAGGGGGGNHKNEGGMLGDPAVIRGQYPYWSDDFADDDYAGVWSPLIGTWVESGGALRVNTTQALVTHTAFAYFIEAGVGFSDDIEVFASIASASAFNACIGRMYAFPDTSGYYTRVTASGVTLNRADADVATVLATYAGGAPVTGDQIGFRIKTDNDGTNHLAAIINGRTVATAEDATYTLGQLFLGSRGGSKPWFSNWGTR